MEIKAFLIRFEKNLIASGFSPDTARHHTLKIAKGLDESDKARILAMTNEAQADAVAKSYVTRLKRRTAVPEADTMANTSTISKSFSGSIHTGEVEKVKVYNTRPKNAPVPERDDVKVAPVSVVEEFEDNDATRQFTQVREIATEEDFGETRQFTQIKDVKGADDNSATRQFSQVKTYSEDCSDNVSTTIVNVVKKHNTSDKKADGRTKNISKVPAAKINLSPEAKKEFTKQILSRMPLFILGFAGAGLGALAVYGAIALLITAFLALLVGVVITGGVATLAGIIYGIIKLFSITPEGLYEIGFALAIAGVTMALSICSYNVAVRAIPVLWRKFTYFLTDCINKFRTYVRRIRKECADR